MIWHKKHYASQVEVFFSIAPEIWYYIYSYLSLPCKLEYICMRAAYICMPTSDHWVGVINSPRTSHSLSAIGVDAVAEAALPVALRAYWEWVRSSQGVLTRNVSGCKRVWYKRHWASVSRGAGWAEIGRGADRFAEIEVLEEERR